MTGVKAGVKGNFRALNAPKVPKNAPPAGPPKENDHGYKTHTQECNHSLKFLYIEQVWFVHECSKCSKLVLSNRYEGS